MLRTQLGQSVGRPASPATTRQPVGMDTSGWQPEFDALGVEPGSRVDDESIGDYHKTPSHFQGARKAKVKARLKTGASQDRRPRSRLATIHESCEEPTSGWAAASSDASGGEWRGRGGGGQSGLPPASHHGGIPRPAQQRALGVLTMKASSDHCNATRLRASIERGVLTLARVASSPSRDGDRSGDEDVVATVPLEDLAVGVQRERADMFFLATRHEGKLYDDICCVFSCEEERDKWVATFRQVGVATVHLNDKAARSGVRSR